ncbi:MAG: ATP-binding cassette domain-containing protein [Caldilineaceae bacterium]
MGLTKWADHRPYEMSGGQQQRVAIARAVANSPQMIIADEPTGELDSRTATEILGLFQTLVKERHMTMLMATHDSLSDEFVDQVLRLKDGQIMTHEEFLAEEEAERAAQEAALAAAAWVTQRRLSPSKPEPVEAGVAPASTSSASVSSTLLQWLKQRQ